MLHPLNFGLVYRPSGEENKVHRFKYLQYCVDVVLPIGYETGLVSLQSRQGSRPTFFHMDIVRRLLIHVFTDSALRVNLDTN
jgi:hypothetical protein